jgi:hypothetical protein
VKEEEVNKEVLRSEKSDSDPSPLVENQKGWVIVPKIRRHPGRELRSASERFTRPFSARRSEAIRADLDFLDDLPAGPSWIVCKLHLFLTSLAIDFFPERIADDTGLYDLFPERHVGADAMSAYGTYIHRL